MSAKKSQSTQLRQRNRKSLQGFQVSLGHHVIRCSVVCCYRFFSLLENQGGISSSKQEDFISITYVWCLIAMCQHSFSRIRRTECFWLDFKLWPFCKLFNWKISVFLCIKNFTLKSYCYTTNLSWNCEFCQQLENANIWLIYTWIWNYRKLPNYRITEAVSFGNYRNRKLPKISDFGNYRLPIYRKLFVGNYRFQTKWGTQKKMR